MGDSAHFRPVFRIIRKCSRDLKFADAYFFFAGECGGKGGEILFVLSPSRRFELARSLPPFAPVMPPPDAANTQRARLFAFVLVCERMLARWLGPITKDWSAVLAS